MQHEITKAIPLLDEKGNLTEPGYAKRLLPIYDRTKVKGGKTRLKEWDYYYVGNDRYGIALTIADNSYMGLDSISFLSFEGTPWEITKSPMRIFPMGKTGLPESSASGVSKISGSGYTMEFVVAGGKRVLTAHMDNFRGKEPIDIQVTLLREPEESMVISLRKGSSLLLQSEDQLHAGLRHRDHRRRPLHFLSRGQLRRSGLGSGCLDLS